MKLSRTEKQDMINHCKYNLVIPGIKILEPNYNKMFEKMLILVMEAKTYD